MTGDPTIWLIARASGIVGFALLTASVLAGLVLKSRPFGKLLKGSTAMEIHRTLSFLGLAALAVHGVALLMDRAVDIRLTDLLVPGTAPYRPLWTGLGVVAAELMVLVIVSFPLRKRIGMRVWRRLHWASYAIFALALVHGVQAGTDTGRPWARALYIGSVALVGAAATWRWVTATPTPTPRPARGGTATARPSTDHGGT